MSDGRTEERGPAVLLGDGEQRELRLEVDELLDDDLLHVAARTLHGLFESLFQLIIVVHIALTVTGGRHQGLDDTGETDFVGSSLELVEGLGIEILRRAQSQLLGGQVADGTAVHGVVDGTG